ncbi:MAG: hypothetical protein ABS75_21515 [Pelagibacterium sp. SCN 63-23]|nr:MAG: hypothetical protein ABS75_21515 [Pelagibacterium sp. SCN 63-23]
MLAIMLAVYAAPAPLAQETSVEEMEAMIRALDQRIEMTEAVLGMREGIILGLDESIESADETLEEAASLAQIEPIPLIGVEQDNVYAGSPGLPRDGLGFNAWCFNALYNLGVRYGHADARLRDLAGFAMDDARTRMMRLAEQAGMSAAEIENYDIGWFAGTEAVAKAIAEGSANAEQMDLFERCTAKGLAGARVKSSYVAPIEQMHEVMWCGSVLYAFAERQMLSGGQEQAARAERAMALAGEWVGIQFGNSDIASSDADLLRRGYYYRAITQVDGFRLSEGSRGRFEMDYEGCFALADGAVDPGLAAAAKAPSLRPALAAVGWNAPLSAGFRDAIWCAAALRYLGEGGQAMPASSQSADALLDQAELVLGEVFKHGITAGLSIGDVRPMLEDMAANVAFEFQRATRSGEARALSQEPESCWGYGAVVAENSAAPPEAGDAEFAEVLWCLAALGQLGEMVELNADEKMVAEAGSELFTGLLVEQGAQYGLREAALRSRIIDAWPVVRAELPTRPYGDNGALMIDRCFDRALAHYREGGF